MNKLHILHILHLLLYTVGVPSVSMRHTHSTAAGMWGSWWFILLLVLILAVIVSTLVLIRKNSLKRLNERLEVMVSERTAELIEQSDEIRKQAEHLKQTNQVLQNINNEFTLQQNELEHQKNALANLAWELQEKNEEITDQRNEIEIQKDLLTQQKKEITDSIRYAQRIQQAVLPSSEQIEDLFSDFFVFNQAKSIVSGDFYWFSRLGRFKAIAVADCTGHGVPGGFMSMLGTLMLKEVVTLQTVHNPALSLNQLRQSIITVLHQRGDITDSGDGMDLSLCIIDEQKQLIHYSGANSTIIVAQPDASGKPIVKDIKSDRMPISFHTIMKPFSNTTIKIDSDTRIYLFTDGLIDQFGGEHGRKYQLRRFKDFILSNWSHTMPEQGKLLEESFNTWKGNTFQVDDVLVFGFKV